MKNFTSEEFKNIGENEQRVVYFRILNDCYAETHNEQLAAEMTFLGSAIRQLDTLEQTGNFGELLRLTRKIDGMGFHAVSNRVRHVRALLLNNQLDEALNIADPLARILPDDWAVNLHLAHVFLLKNDVKRAEKVYFKFKNEKNSTHDNPFTKGRTWAQMVSDDFNFFIKNRIFNSNFENIKRKLKIRD
ncbi:MAG: tetratricopeptide repeat protein [Saprospiraceae bacterium]|nr:tetratricopeptide repeat protein [Saprospiraceae bacterium]